MPADNTYLSQNVNQSVIDASAELADSFARAKPFRHVQIDNFFTPEVCRQLAESFPAFDESLAVNEDGIVGNKAVHEKIMHLGPAWECLDELVQHPSFRELISSITGIPDLQYDPHYFGGGTHENRHGQGLGAHIDFNYHPITHHHRRLNLIVYLNEEWQPEWGGSIQLHKDPYLPPAQDQIVSITPQFNRCVIFETNEYSWHGFPRIQLPGDKRSMSRRSFALYYYTDTRPEEDTGPEHSTIYVDAHLSEDIQAGMELTEAQLQHVQTLIASRDQHLKRLYGHIKHQNTMYNELKAYHSEQMTNLDALKGELLHLRSATDQAGTEASSKLDQRAGEIQQLSRTISALEKKLRDMETSTSWRLTGPLRQLKRVFTGQ